MHPHRAAATGASPTTKKANGDWDFPQPRQRQRGIFADTIFTGRLSGAAGLNYWDLDTGRFVMTDANGNETVHLDGNGAATCSRRYL